MEEELSAIIKFHRKKSGLSQHQLATLAGVGKSVIFDIEKGKETIQFNTLKKVLHALNIELKYQSPLMDTYQKQSDLSNEKS